MIYLPVNLLEPGMILARNVPSMNANLPLIVAGQPLTTETIEVMVSRGIKGIYVGFGDSEELELNEVLTPERKQSMLSDIKTEFQKIARKGKEPDYQLINRMANDIVMGVLDQDQVLHNVMDIRDYDNYTYSHSMYVGILSVALGNRLKLPAVRLEELAIAGLLHDIGKLDIAVGIINKPTNLSVEEFEIMKEHPLNAVKRMWSIAGNKDAVLQGVASHHEKFDGSGYPRGLSGTHIPLYGRILAIADVYDALSSTRSYREAWTPAKIIDYLLSNAGIQFDPDILREFLCTVAAYPVGTLVKLSDASIGIVIKNNVEFTLRPTIRILMPLANRNKELDLSKEAYHLTVLDTVTKDDNVRMSDMMQEK